MSTIRRVLFVAVLIPASACALFLGTSQRPYPALERVGRIQVETDYQRGTLPAITDSARIAAVVAFVNHHRDGWRVPWWDVPVPRIAATFFSVSGAPIRRFGAGPGFFETARGVDFASKNVSDSEIAEFLKLLGAPHDAVSAPH
jgi:hypothetical protein